MLHVQPGSATASRGRDPVLSLDARARIGINIGTPRHTLDVAGVVASTGRRGTHAPAQAIPILANGEWQDITDTLSGCQAFEVMAGAGQPGAGRYALMHAIALNAYNPDGGWFGLFSNRKRITPHHAWYGRRCDKLQLRWEGTSGRNAAYRLRIRSGCDYGEGAHIKVFLTRLWFDETTQEAES
jgi:hypothetical protein